MTARGIRARGFREWADASRGGRSHGLHIRRLSGHSIGVKPRHLAALSALLAAACTPPPPGPVVDPEVAKAKSVEYDAIGGHVNSMITVKGWILGEGVSSKVDVEPPKYYFLLCPPPGFDWKAFFEPHDEAEKALASLEGRDDERAGSAEIGVFNRLQQVAQEWRELARAHEATDQTRVWCEFDENLFGANYEQLISGTEPLLVRPTRKELRDAMQFLVNRFHMIADSMEIEVTGKLHRTKEWKPEQESSAGSIKTMLEGKEFVLEVHHYKILRRAKDALDDDVSGTGRPGTSATPGE